MVTNEQKIIRASSFISSIFGTAPPAILVEGKGVDEVRAEGGGRDLTVYSNRPLKGFVPSSGAYVRKLQDLNGDIVDYLGTDARYIRFFTTYTEIKDGVVVEHREDPRPTKLAETVLGLDAYRKEGYAKVPSRDLWFRLDLHHSYIPEADFPEDMTLAHEMTHGVVGVEGERIPVLVERMYLSEFYPENVARWDENRRNLETDPAHMDAFKVVTTPEGREVLKKELEEFLCR